MPFAHSFLATRVRDSELASTSLLGAAMPASTPAFEVHGADIPPAPKRPDAYDPRERAQADLHHRPPMEDGASAREDARRPGAPNTPKLSVRRSLSLSRGSIPIRRAPQPTAHPRHRVTGSASAPLERHPPNPDRHPGMAAAPPARRAAGMRAISKGPLVPRGSHPRPPRTAHRARKVPFHVDQPQPPFRLPSFEPSPTAPANPPQTPGDHRSSPGGSRGCSSRTRECLHRGTPEPFSESPTPPTKRPRPTQHTKIPASNLPATLRRSSRPSDPSARTLWRRLEPEKRAKPPRAHPLPPPPKRLSPRHLR